MASGSFGAGFDNLLEGAAALFVIYWLLASGCSFLAETISSMLNTRGNALRQFAIDMVQGEIRGKATPWLGHGAEPAWNAFCGWITKRIDLDSARVTGFAASIFSHNLMKSFEQPKLFRSGANTAPAYVPSKVFAQTVVDRLLNVAPFRHFASIEGVPGMSSLGSREADGLRRKLLAVTDAIDAAAAGLALDPNATAANVLRDALARINESPVVADFRNAVDAALGNTSPFHVAAAVANPASPAAVIANHFFGSSALAALQRIPARQAATVAAVASALDRPDVPLALKQALRPFLDAANHDVDALTNGIAVWYDASMARATGWYKRYSQFVLAILGLGVAILFNIDTPRVIGALVESPGLRAAGYAAASDVVGQGRSQAQQVIPQQVAFIRAVDRQCGRSEAACSLDDKTARKLLPLTLTSGANSQVLMYLEADRQSRDAAKAAGDMGQRAARFAAMMNAFCATPNSCSKSVGGDDRTVADVIGDPMIFWNSALAQCIYLRPAPDAQAADCGKSAASARASAMVAAGAVSSYIDAVTGLDQGGTIDPNAAWNTPRGIVSRISHWFGLLITGLMVSFGAPFWFDLLQQIVNRRGAGPKPAEAVPTDLA